MSELPLRGMPCGLVVADADGRILAVNDRLCEVTGRSAEALRGQNVSGLFTVVGRTMYQTYLLPLLRLHGRVEEFAIALRGPDGHGADMLIHACVDTQGPEPRLHLAFVPYRARRAVDDELLRVRRAADRAPGMIFEFEVAPDGAARFPYASDSIRTRYGCTPDQVRADATPLLRQFDAEGRARLLGAQPRSGEELLQHFVTQRVDDEGGTAWHEVHATARRRADGSVSWQGHVADVSARLALQEEASRRHAAEQVRLSQAEFLGRVSHELKTPLNAILAFAQLLASGEPHRLSATQLQHVGLIGSAGGQLLHLVDELIDVSRLQGDGFAVSMAPVALDAVVGRCVALAAPQAGAAGVSLSVSPRVDGLAVVADERRLVQVLANLVSNAIKYNRRGGTVRIRARACGGRVRLTVDDSGRGMTPQQMQALFRPFDRLGAERSEVQGTGLGLVITRQLVERMGGRIEVESEAGVGSRFHVEFAAAAAAATVSRHLPLPLPRLTGERPGDSALPVLYVEDNEVNVVVMEAIVAHCPQVVLHTAGSVQAALRHLAVADPPVLLLIDHRLPDGTGSELLQRLRQDPRLRHVPAYLLTADTAEEAAAAVRAAGFDGVWSKPLDVHHTIAALEAALHWSALQRDDTATMPLQ